MEKSLKRAIRDFQKTFPEVQPMIDDALIMNYSRYGKQTQKQKKLFLKFSNAVKIIMKVKFA